MFKCLEKLSKEEDKYTDVFLMENYQFFWLALQNRPRPVLALQHAMDQGRDLFRNHQDMYVKWSLNYELPEVIKFWDTLEDTLKGTAAEDVQFSNGLRKTELRDLNKSYLNPKNVQKKLLSAASRLHKHLPKNQALEREV